MQWIEVEERVRFNEVDEWGLIWYGNYMAYFDIGRMALLRKFDLLPRQLVDLGYIAPVIKLSCDFKKTATSDDDIIIRTTVIKPETAVLNFKFEILLRKNRDLLARGETVQVLLTTGRKFIYRLSGELKSRIDRLLRYCMQNQA
jgi:acyl-CoA thioester hydrolase